MGDCCNCYCAFVLLKLLELTQLLRYDPLYSVFRGIFLATLETQEAPLSLLSSSDYVTTRSNLPVGASVQ
jgi:hypothetical protein